MNPERVVLVWAVTQRIDDQEEKHVMDELEGLVDSAGGMVAARFTQNRPGIDPRWVVGEGKLDEIKSVLSDLSIDLVVFHNSLSGSQQRNVEQFLKVRVIDRTRLILDVFALRARSQEGKLQVELAQLMYMLPRLSGQGLTLSRLGGGIGTRGPGETKLESDRRTIKRKIAQLREKIGTVSKVRGTHRQGRKRSIVPVIALVGYTSAGKSTLFSRLSHFETECSEKLFSTLDPLVRRVDLGVFLPGCHALVSDTVGFIRDMPKEVKNAFKATLEEIRDADLIVMVLDASHPGYAAHRRSVEAALSELKEENQEVWVVFNKIDKLPDGVDGFQSGFPLSALTGEGVDSFLESFFLYWMSDKGRYLVCLEKSQRKNVEMLETWAMILRKWVEGERYYIDMVTRKENIEPFIKKTGAVCEELNNKTWYNP